MFGSETFDPLFGDGCVEADSSDCMESESRTSGDGCLGLGTRVVVKEADKKRRGETSQLLVLALERKINCINGSF